MRRRELQSHMRLNYTSCENSSLPRNLELRFQIRRQPISWIRDSRFFASLKLSQAIEPLLRFVSETEPVRHIYRSHHNGPYGPLCVPLRHVTWASHLYWMLFCVVCARACMWVSDGSPLSLFLSFYPFCSLSSFAIFLGLGLQLGFPTSRTAPTLSEVHLLSTLSFSISLPRSLSLERSHNNVMIILFMIMAKLKKRKKAAIVTKVMCFVVYVEFEWQTPPLHWFRYAR